MTESDQDAIHTRLDYIEEKWGDKFSQMAEGMTKMAEGMTKLSEQLADVRLLTDRTNQHSILIKKNDERLDKVEQKTPAYDQIVEDRKNNSLMIKRALIGSIISIVVVGMVGLVWAAIANQ
jgi:uncharacterized protein Yka (UPF0111/DUF47 family)